MLAASGRKDALDRGFLLERGEHGVAKGTGPAHGAFVV